jgi:gluconokinase
LLNRKTLTWDDELFSYLPVKPEQMLPLCDCRHHFSSLSDEYAKRWPILAEIPWVVAIGDGAAANLGSGCICSNQIALTLGTTGAMRIITNNPVFQVPTGLWNYPIDKNRSLTGGAMTEGGNVYSWMKKSLKYPDNAGLIQTLMDMPPDDHNLTILPLFSGERSPGWIGNARATIHGLTLDTSSVDIYRAMLEAISLRFSLIYDLLEPLSTDSAKIIANGGALLQNPLWLQIMSDVLNRPVIISRVSEVSSRGTALNVLDSLNSSISLSKLPHFLGTLYKPNQTNHQIYQQAKIRQKELYQLLVKPSL